VYGLPTEAHARFRARVFGGAAARILYLERRLHDTEYPVLYFA
jgi:hypothetical protein